ncbi:hypothetical protein CHARACLAT_007875 [Characodon lateralis]|uniref:Uncharacterized protein n=1 Tax=Characodon lateralis TaxID=208331 RepID=A0ABU7EHA7_9TELE|nr:hypothetical protein [Characodon lateralis]
MWSSPTRESCFTISAPLLLSSWSETFLEEVNNRPRVPPAESDFFHGDLTSERTSASPAKLHLAWLYVYL